MPGRGIYCHKDVPNETWHRMGAAERFGALAISENRKYFARVWSGGRCAVVREVGYRCLLLALYLSSTQTNAMSCAADTTTTMPAGMDGHEHDQHCNQQPSERSLNQRCATPPHGTAPFNACPGGWELCCGAVARSVCSFIYSQAPVPEFPVGCGCGVVAN